MRQMIVNFLDRYAVSDWRDWWKWWSTWSLTMLGLWNMLPFVLTGYIPLAVQISISIFLFGTVLLARIWDQPKLEGDE